MSGSGSTSRSRFAEYLRSAAGNAAGTGSPASDAAPRRQRSLATLLRRFGSLIRGQRRLVAAALVLLTASTLLKLTIPTVTKLAIDHVFLGQPLPESIGGYGLLPEDRGQLLVTLALAALAAGIAGRGLRIRGQSRACVACLRAQAAVRRKAFEHAVRLPLHRLARIKSGGAPGLIREDASAPGNLILNMLYYPWQSVIQLGGSLALLAWLDWQLLLGTLALLPVFYVTYHVRARRIRPIHRDVLQGYQVLDGHLTEVFAGARVVRVFRRETAEARRFARQNHLVLRQQMLNWRWAFVVDAVWGLVLPAASCGLMIFGGFQVLRGQLTPGDMTMFLVLVAAFCEPLATLASNSTDVQNDLARLDRVLDLFDEPLELHESAAVPALRPVRTEGRLSLRNVGFRYPGSDRFALRGVDLEVAPGEVVGLVGPSGAGKTTLSNLIARFYDPTEGAIELDGTDIRRIERRHYRGLLAVVEQDVFLFDGTVAENIGYASTACTREQVEAAARVARADEFIRRLPGGYDAVIGERGVRLSGGQRQRLAIARAVLADPGVMIWDEATSNLDGEHERQIHWNYRELARGRTCFIIAHRLSTVAHADRIVVLEAGRVVEVGSHQELLGRGTRYRRMLELQLTNYPAANGVAPEPDPPAEPVAPAASVSVTVAVCTWNRARELDRTLDAMARLTLPAGLSWELVVVNNNSTDDTDTVIERHASRLPIVRVFEPEQGLARARNAAARKARGELVVFTDDDVLIEPGWLAAYVDAAARWPGAAFFAGPIALAFDEPPPPLIARNLDWLGLHMGRLDQGDAERPITDSRSVYGANMAFRRGVFERCRFDHGLGVSGAERLSGEETDFVEQILRLGLHGVGVPAARLAHRVGADYLSPPRLLRTLTGRGRTHGKMLLAKGPGLSAGRRLRIAASCLAKIGALRLRRALTPWNRLPASARSAWLYGVLLEMW